MAWTRWAIIYGNAVAEAKLMLAERQQQSGSPTRRPALAPPPIPKDALTVDGEGTAFT